MNFLKCYIFSSKLKVLLPIDGESLHAALNQGNHMDFINDTFVVEQYEGHGVREDFPENEPDESF